MVMGSTRQRVHHTRIEVPMGENWSSQKRTSIMMIQLLFFLGSVAAFTSSPKLRSNAVQQLDESQVK